MKNLSRELRVITNQQWTVLISLLTLVNLVVLGGLVWLLAVQSPDGFRRVLAQAPATRTPLPTFTGVADRLAFVTPTGTHVPTWTPTDPFAPTGRARDRGTRPRPGALRWYAPRSGLLKACLCSG